MENIIGKTVKSIRKRGEGTDEKMNIRFTDGTLLTIKSWDYEGYSSGLHIVVK